MYKRQSQGDAHQKWGVPAQTRRDGGLSQARVREHLLDEHRPAKDLADRRELQRQRRHHQIAQPMPHEHVAGGLPTGAGEAHVIALHHVDDLLARMQGHSREAGDGQGERGQHHMVQAIEKREVARTRADGDGEAQGLSLIHI